MQWSKPDPGEARHNRLASLGNGLGVQGMGCRLDEGAHTNFKLGSQGASQKECHLAVKVGF